MLNTAAQQLRFSFLPVFIASSRRSQSALKLTSRTVVSGNHGSIWDSWPIAMSGYPRGLQLDCETRCTRHAKPNFRVETHPRTPVPQNRTRHRRRGSPGTERNRVRDTQLFVASDIGRQTRLLSSTRSRRSWSSTREGPFREFYEALVAKGMRPEMARLPGSPRP